MRDVSLTSLTSLTRSRHLSTGLDCVDYDLCSRCLPQAKSIHPVHSFVTVREKDDIIGHPATRGTQNRQGTKHHGIACDGEWTWNAPTTGRKAEVCTTFADPRFHSLWPVSYLSVLRL